MNEALDGQVSKLIGGSFKPGLCFSQFLTGNPNLGCQLTKVLDAFGFHGHPQVVVEGRRGQHEPAACRTGVRS